MTTTPNWRPGNRPDDRQAATLSEVLIALLILGIGLVSVATLFPLSLLRSVRATQLTNATILRQNAEVFLAAATTSMEQGDGESPFAVIADPDNRDSDTADSDNDGYPGTITPVVGTPGNEPYDDGAIAFVLDPLGAQRLPGVDFAGTYPRYDAGLTTAATRRAATTLGDGTTAVGTLTVPTDVTITPPNVLVLTGTDAAVAVREAVADDFTRVILESADGTRSVTRLVTNGAGGTTLTLDEDLPEFIDGDNVPPSPPNPSDTPGRLVFENIEDRYSWLATVRRSSDPDVTRPRTAAVYLATFFRRGFGDTTTDERPYRFIEGAGAGEPFFVAWENGDPQPRIRKGTWFCNLEDLRWYLVSEVLGQFRDNDVPDQYDVDLGYVANDLNNDGTPNDLGPAIDENIIAFKVSPEFVVPITGRKTGQSVASEGAGVLYDPTDPASLHEYPRAIFPRGVITVFPFTVTDIP
ncbi:MAG: hypothetical protein AAF532_08305 [Planctomycetota bacterium]